MRFYLALIITMAALALGLLALLRDRERGPVSAAGGPSVAGAARFVAAAGTPRIDTVRVEGEGGGAVVAGRAGPDARVTLLVNGVAAGEAAADGRGDWVIVIDGPLGPAWKGTIALSLRAVTPEGRMIPSAEPMLVTAPEPPPDGQAPTPQSKTPEN